MVLMRAITKSQKIVLLLKPFNGDNIYRVNFWVLGACDVQEQAS